MALKDLSLLSSFFFSLIHHFQAQNLSFVHYSFIHPRNTSEALLHTNNYKVSASRADSAQLSPLTAHRKGGSSLPSPFVPTAILSHSTFSSDFSILLNIALIVATTKKVSQRTKPKCSGEYHLIVRQAPPSL